MKIAKYNTSIYLIFETEKASEAYVIDILLNLCIYFCFLKVGIFP